MTTVLIELLKRLRGKRTRWALCVGLTVVLVAAHVVMYNKYAGTEKEPSAEFTIFVHLGITVAIVAMVWYYKKFLKSLIVEER